MTMISPLFPNHQVLDTDVEVVVAVEVAVLRVRSFFDDSQLKHVVYPRFHIPKIATTMGIARQMTILGLTICRMTPRSQARGRVLHVRQSIITVRNDIFGLAVVH